MDADRVGADLLGLADEPLPHLPLVRVAVVEPPAVAVALEGVGEVRERLPGGDRIRIGRVLHRGERGVELPDVRQRLAVQQDALVTAERRGDLARQVHHVVALRASLGEDRQRREHEHVRVRAQEHQLEEVLDRVAGSRVVLTAVLLRERRPEVLPVQHGVQVVLEQVALDVEDELLAAERLERALGLDRRARRDLVACRRASRRSRSARPGRPACSSAVQALSARNAVAAPHDREQELPPRHAEPVGVLDRPGRGPGRSSPAAPGGSRGSGSYSPLEAGPNSIGSPGSWSRRRCGSAHLPSSRFPAEMTLARSGRFRETTGSMRVAVVGHTEWIWFGAVDRIPGAGRDRARHRRVGGAGRGRGRRGGAAREARRLVRLLHGARRRRARPSGSRRAGRTSASTCMRPSPRRPHPAGAHARRPGGRAHDHDPRPTSRATPSDDPLPWERPRRGRRRLRDGRRRRPAFRARASRPRHGRDQPCARRARSTPTSCPTRSSAARNDPRRARRRRGAAVAAAAARDRTEGRSGGRYETSSGRNRELRGGRGSAGPRRRRLRCRRLLRRRGSRTRSAAAGTSIGRWRSPHDAGLRAQPGRGPYSGQLTAADV